MSVYISFLIYMTFHNHLHEHTKDENESFFFRYAVAIGILGMALSFIGNVKQTNEMYPLFMYDNSTEVHPSYRFLVINFLKNLIKFRFIDSIKALWIV